ATFDMLDLRINHTLPGVTEQPTISIFVAGIRSPGESSAQVLRPSFSLLASAVSKEMNSSSKYVYVLPNDHGLLEGMHQKSNTTQQKALEGLLRFAQANGFPIRLGSQSNGAATMFEALKHADNASHASQQGLVHEVFAVAPALRDLKGLANASIAAGAAH